jgi:hypothetical protein
MVKIKFLLAIALIAMAFSCSDDSEEFTFSAKQRLLLGKWSQAEVYPPGSDVNALSPCERETNTIFDFRKDGTCFISNAADCTPARTSEYALSYNGNIFAIEGVFYNVYSLTDSVFFFGVAAFENNTENWRQVWRRVR